MTNGDNEFDIDHRCLGSPVVTSERLSTRQAILGRIHSQTETIKQRELETAFTKLEAQDELTGEQRAIIEELADTLVAELLEPPMKFLQDDTRMTQSDLQAVIRLFL